MDTIYEIRIKERLSETWAEWFAPLVIQHEPTGGSLLVGPLCDQAALHGVLVKLRDLNVTLLGLVIRESQCDGQARYP